MRNTSGGAVTVPHEPWLVALSIAIAIQGSFVGLSLAGLLDSTEGFRRRLILAGASLTLATGVWSMHFVGMLAANFPSAVDYLVLPTLVSFLICVIMVGVGVYAIHTQGAPAARIGGGAVAMGLGISLMHYVGMSAVHLAGPTRQSAPFVIASVIVSIAASALALSALERRPTRSSLFLGAVGLGLAISGMHYTAMAGMRLDPQCFDVSRFIGADSALSRNTLALLATVVAFGVSGAFLLSLVPDVHREHAELPVPLLAMGVSAPRSAIEPEGVRSEPAQASVARSHTLAIEKKGRTQSLAVDSIYAIRANAHYTYVHDGEQEYFCGLSISALEQRLDPGLFLRIHRSHIVAVRRIERVKRSGGATIAELGAPVRCSIPIARGQVRELKRRMDSYSA